MCCAVASAALGCGGGDDAIAIAIVAPGPGAQVTRDALAPDGALAAGIDVQLEVEGAPARVGLVLGAMDLGDVAPDGRATAWIATAGTVTLTATAYDDAGGAAATASVEVTVVDPVVADCHGWLDLYGVGYTVGPTRPGVTDPVTATMPINGIPFRTGATTARETMFGDCTLIRSLAEAAPFLRRRQIAWVTDLGVYNYRCINNNGTPPNCPNGISEHAYGNAIDLASFEDASGTTYSVEDDWVIDPAPEKTCEAPTEPGKDAFLHELICELKANAIWNIVLTPNYNAAHRNHFHVDLTAGADTIRRSLAPHPDSDVSGRVATH